MKTVSTDVLVIGGGLAGLTLTGVLGEAGLNVTCIDRDAPARQLDDKHDGRTTAISYASRRVLEAAGAADIIDRHGEAILDIRVADGAAPVFLHFSAETDKAFGWIVENNLLRRALFDNLQRLKKNVRHLAPATIREFVRDGVGAGVILEDGRVISAPLMVGADGRKSAVREWCGIETRAWRYKQTAVVCNVAHARDHENVAVEHFLPAGPFAILPMTKSETGEHRSSVVWTVEEGAVEKILSLSPAAFDARLQELFGLHLGRVRHVSKPMSYPLSLMHAKSYTADRVALMAEAAHVMHPIAGQGLNLSMRDIAVLAELVVDQLRRGLDPGAESLLQSYDQWRKSDVVLMTGFTDILNRLFSNDLKTVAALRGFGLGIVDKTRILKDFFAHQAMGLGGRSPRIIRDGRL